MSRTGRLFASSLICCSTMATAPALNAFPSRPITLVVSSSAGGITDAMARVIAASMTKTLKQNVVVENKAGANGVVAAGSVASAKPDGYTLCFCHSGPITVASVSMPKLPYDIDTAFQPVTRVYELRAIVLVPADSEIHSAQQLIETAKSKPAAMTYAHPGVGGALHLGFELLSKEAGFQLTSVAYQGESPMISDLVNARVDAGIASPLFAKSQARTGKVRMLLSLGNPSPISGVPSVSDLGYSSAKSSTWAGVFAPAGTPAKVVETLYESIQSALREPSVRKHLEDAGLSPVDNETPAELSAFATNERAQWIEVVKGIGGLRE